MKNGSCTRNCEPYLSRQRDRKYGKPYLATVPAYVGMGRLLVVREARRPAIHQTVEPSG